MTTQTTFKNISTLVFALAGACSIVAGLLWGVQFYCLFSFMYLLGVSSALAYKRSKAH